MSPESVDTLAARLDALSDLVSDVRVDIREMRVDLRELHDGLDQMRVSHETLHRELAEAEHGKFSAVRERLVKVESAITWRTWAGGGAITALGGAVIALVQSWGKPLP